MRQASFQLRKWYFDSADENGNLLIGYAGKVKWKGIGVSFSSILKKERQKNAETVSSLRKIELPDSDSKTMQYKNPLFEVSAERIQRAASEILIETEKGFIEWNCHFPHAHTEIRAEKNLVRGTGYAEELIMTIKPWEFRISELYWGRFISENTYITWIEWRGEWKKFMIIENGKKFGSGKISEDSVEFECGKLTFENVSVLRSGSLISTVFKKFPLIRKLFPLKALMIDETKWFSKGRFIRTDKQPEEGYCVYEKVMWL